MAWLNGWTKRIPITLDPTTISGGGLSEDLTDFPARIKIADSSGRNGADLTKVFDDFLVEVGFDDDFTGTNNDPPNTVRWYQYSSTNQDYPYISSNKLRMNNSDSTTSTQYALNLANPTGDFDVQVDWQVNSATNPTSSHHYMYIYISFSDGGSVQIARTRKPDGSPRYIFSPPSTEKPGTADGGPGKFKITRVGTVIKGFYWSGGIWQYNGSTNGFTFDTTSVGEARVYLRYTRRDAATWDVSWDNLVVNSSDGMVEARSDENKKKIAVTADDGVTQYPVEIDYWDANGSVADLWVKIPTIASGTNTQLYLYYESTQSDNTDYVADTPTTASGVWDSNYTGVWHMSQRPFTAATDTILESTSNAFHGTPSGSMHVGDYRASQIGRDVEFDGVDEYINVGNAFSSNYITIEATVKTDQAANGQLISKDNNPDNRSWQFRKDSNGKFSFIPFKANDDFTIVTGTTDITDMEWHGLAGVWDGTTVRVYVDGIEENNASFSGTLNTTTNNILFGAADTDSPDYFDGEIDDVRISSTARSGEWLKTAYQSDIDTLFTFTDAEYNVGISKGADPTFPNIGEATVYGSIPSGRHDGHVSVYYGLVDGGTSAVSWDSSVYAGLKTSSSSFNTTLSGLTPFQTYYYRWHTTYSGSLPSEEWTPSYTFYLSEGRVLKGTSADFIAVSVDPTSTFYNTRFAALSHGSGAALTVVQDDEINNYWLSSPDAIDEDTLLSLTIDSSKMPSAQTNFPVFVRISDSSGITNYDNTSIFDVLGSNDKKLKVLTTDGTECYVEIERWDSANREAELWVRVPSISATEDTVLYLKANNSWADNTTYVGDIGSTPGQTVWGTGDTGMVYHMNQDPTGGSGCILDSCATIRNGTPTNDSNAWDSNDLVAGRLGMGKSLLFDRHFVDLGAHTFTGVNQMMFSAWVYATGFSKTDYCGIIVDSNIKMSMFYDDNYNGFKTGHFSSTHWLTQNGTWQSTGVWIHVVTMTDASTMRVYLNGSLSSSTGCGHTLTTGGTWRIGRRHDGGGASNIWSGRIDEVHIHNYSKGNSYVSSQYESERDNLITYEATQMGQIRETTSELTAVR